MAARFLDVTGRQKFSFCARQPHAIFTFASHVLLFPYEYDFLETVFLGVKLKTSTAEVTFAFVAGPHRSSSPPPRPPSPRQRGSPTKSMHQHRARRWTPPRSARSATAMLLLQLFASGSDRVFSQSTECGDGMVCRNGGQCVVPDGDKVMSYSCKCNDSWINGPTFTGAQCELPTADCSSGIW